MPAQPRRRFADNWQQGVGSHKVRPPIQQPDISAWMDRVRAQLDPAPPPPKKVELEWVLIAGTAVGLFLLLSGSIYWFAGSNSKKDEPVLVVTGGASMNTADPETVASPPPRKKAPRSETAVREARVARVTEEAPTLPVESDSSSALRTAAKTEKAEARAPAAALTDNQPGPSNAADSRTADIDSTPARVEELKPEAPKTPRREPPPASARPQPAKAATTKLALAEPAAPTVIESVAAAPTLSAPAPVIEMPRLKFMRAPNYPISEMRAGHNGTTTLELLVLESGLVGEVTVMKSSGYPKLDEAAMTVAKKSWRFFPATQDGKPMPMKIEAPVRFSLD